MKDTNIYYDEYFRSLTFNQIKRATLLWKDRVICKPVKYNKMTVQVKCIWKEEIRK